METTTNKKLTCDYCGKPLGEHAIHYVNGMAFCGNECEALYGEYSLHKGRISEVFYEKTLPLYRSNDIERIKSQLAKPERADIILNWKMGQRGLAIMGSTGCGKTRLMTELLKRLIKQDLVGIKCSLEVFYAGELEREILSSFKVSAQYSQLMYKLENCGLLVIDDFGKERFTERFELSVFQIFEKRMARQKPIIFTTNYKGEEFRARFSDAQNYEPLSRRINENFDRVILTKKGN